MPSCWSFLRRTFWPLSAILFGPWHAFVLLAVVSRLTAGSVVAGYIATHYNTLRSVLVVLFSLYFVLALMMWAVGRRSTEPAERSTLPDAVLGLSTGQVILFGLCGMGLVPALMLLSTLPQQAHVMDALQQTLRRMDAAMNAGFVWLICISTIIMIPTMVIWLIWMWRAWSSLDPAQREVTWEYEYE